MSYKPPVSERKGKLYISYIAALHITYSYVLYIYINKLYKLKNEI